MFKRSFAVLVCVLCMASPAFAGQIAGITIPDTLPAGDTTLELNGAGIRTKFGIKLYVSGLFLQQKSQDAAAIVAADEPMAVRLHITSGLITGKKMEDAVRDGFKKSTRGNTQPIAAEIDQMLGIFKDNVSENDVYDLVYTPGKGVAALKNSEPKCTMQGLDFKQALFGIWLCDKPVQKNLKRDMLGL